MIKAKSKEPIELGKTYEEAITGFTGVAVIQAIKHNGGVSVALQPKVGKDGKLPEAFWFDWEALTSAPKPPVPEFLGTKLKDKLTGFEGIAVRSLTHVNRCKQVYLQPAQVDKEGKPAALELFDEERVWEGSGQPAKAHSPGSNASRMGNSID